MIRPTRAWAVGVMNGTSLMPTAALAAMPLNYLAGDGVEIHRQVTDLVAQSGADEVMVTTMLPEPDDRRRVVTEIARVFGLVERITATRLADPVP